METLIGPALARALEKRGIDPTPFRLDPATFKDPKAVEDWVAARYADTNPKMSRAAQGRDPSLAYQKQFAGPCEIRLVAPDGKVIWADGLTIDRDTVVAVLDTKNVDKPGASIYEGTSFLRNVPVEVDGEVISKLEEIHRRAFDDQVRRYAAVIRDPGNPSAGSGSRRPPRRPWTTSRAAYDPSSASRASRSTGKSFCNLWRAPHDSHDP